MALTDPRAIFGVHSFTPYNRTTGLFYGEVRVLKGSSLALSGEQIDLMGGSSKYPWASEDGNITSEISLKVAQFEDFMFELFLGAAPTNNSAETTGNVSTLTNKKGSSTMNATTGIASVTALSGSESDMKFGKYVVKVVSATTVDVYFSSDADIGRGTDGSYQDDDLKITASALTVVSGATVNVPSFGIKFTGGSGAIAMTTGDTATFEVRPINTGSMTVTVGGVANQTFPEFGAIIMAQKRGNQELTEIDCFRCKAVGMPINFEQNAFSETEIKIKALYDSTADGVFKMRTVKPA